MQEQLPIKWSAIDEAHLQALLQQKAEFEKRARKPIEALADQLWCACDHQREISDWLISHADQVRDALEPFDSGVRVSE